jgi:signal transduction histidine kinase
MKSHIRSSVRWWLYVVLGVVLLFLAIYILLLSIGLMERAFIATSLLSTLIGFTLLSASLYLLKLSASIYAVEREQTSEK